MILRCFLTRDPFVLIRAFKIYVRPLVEYAFPVWSPVSQAQIEKLEKVQRRFTKRLFGLSKMTYAARLQYLELQPLERRRLNQDLIMCYKIVRGMVDVNLSDFFFTLSGSSITRGHCYKISFHHCRVNARLNFSVIEL